MTVRRYLPLALTVVFLVAAGAVIVPQIVTGGASGSDPLSGPRTPCTSRTPITLASSSEKSDLLRQPADEYDRLPGGCADVDVTTVNSGEAAASLARGWNSDADGPRPDVWSPASSTWVPLGGRGAAAGVVPDSGPSIAQSPLVIAMPRPMAEAMDWPNGSVGWRDLVRLGSDPRGWGLAAHPHPEWGPFTLGKTNPTVSTSGLNSMIGAYQAAPDPAGPVSAQKVADPRARAFERSLEHSVVHYGPTELTFLQNLYDAGQQGRGLSYISAVTVEEKSIWDYNQGNPRGDPAGLVGAVRPATPLAAFSPADGTVLSDSPFLVLHWPDGDKSAAAVDFGRWLLEDRQQQRFQAVGFRDHLGRPGPAINPAEGMLPAPPSRPIAPDAATADATLASWPEVRKRAAVTVVMDRSGSMNDVVPGTGRSRLDLATQATTDALRQLTPDDTLSLWTFSAPQGADPLPYRTEVGLGPVADTAPRVRRALGGVMPSGGTALYQTIQATVDAVRQSFDPDRINAVIVLTDGRNEDTPVVDPGPMLADLGAPDRPAVRVFSIAYGGEADLDGLRRVGQASRGFAYDAQQPQTIERVLGDVLANF